MKVKKVAITGALILMLPATGAQASVPDRATAAYYVAPAPVSRPQISLKGHLTTMPAVLHGSVSAFLSLLEVWLKTLDAYAFSDGKRFDVGGR
jgi:hypothetical protein